MTAPSAAYASAHHGAKATETAAQQRIAPKAGTIRDRLLILVVDAGPAGLTATEALDLYRVLYGEPRGGLYSIAPRLSELERRGGWVEPGPVRDHRTAYVATTAGRAWAAAR